jgi:DNA-binding response OmpR family regulator
VRALVVDDSPTVREIMRFILEEAGFHVMEAGDADAALSCLDGGPVPDVAVVDWKMPGMDGFSLVRALREEPRTQRMRIIVVTKHTTLDAVMQARDAGADEFLEKPFNRDAVRKVLGRVGLRCEG